MTEVLRQFEPLLRTLAAVANGNEEPRAEMVYVLAQLEQKGWMLRAPVERIWAGERDQAALVTGLDAHDTALITHLLGLLPAQEAAPPAAAAPLAATAQEAAPPAAAAPLAATAQEAAPPAAAAPLAATAQEAAPPTTTALAAIQAAAEGLWMPSETDAPFEPFQWPGAEPLTPTALLAYLGLPADTPVAQADPVALLDNLAAEQDWFGDQERATAARFAALRQTMTSQLTALTLYRLGQIRITLVMVGRASSGQLVGLKTLVVET